MAFVFQEVMMMPRVVLGQRGVVMEGQMQREGSQLLSHQPSTLAQCEVPRDVPGMGSRVSPVCGHLCIRVMSWGYMTGEVCGRA